MLAAHTVEELLEAPVGKYFASSSFLYFYPRSDISGFALWGCPSRDDIRVLNRLMDAVLSPAGGPHASLIDTAGLTSVDAAAFAEMTAYLATRWQAFRSVIRRQALLRPAGLAGAVVAGFYDVLAPTYPTAVFTHPGDAFEWLGVDAEAAAVLTRARSLAEQTFDPLLGRLQRHLETNARERPRLDEAAAALGVSERTLQRRLHAAGTTFQGEVQRAHVRVAQQLMTNTDASLTTIALEAGCASLQHFSTLFRKIVGTTPSDWREARRRAHGLVAFP